MASVSYLFRRGASYSARIRVPLDLVEVVGAKELVKALGTKEQSEAKRLMWPVIQAWHSHFDDLRARRLLTQDDQDHAVWDHYSAATDRDEVSRGQVPSVDEVASLRRGVVDAVRRGEVDTSDPEAVMIASLDFLAARDAPKIAADHRAAKLAELRLHLTKGETALIADEVDEVLRTQRLLVKRGSPDWISLARSMMRAEIEALQRGQERDRGDYTGQAKDPIVRPAFGPRRQTAKPGESIMEVFEIFASENPRGVAKDRVDQCRRDIGTFVETVGASFPIGMITKAEVRTWKQLLVKYPVKATETKVFAGMNIHQFIKANEKIGKPVIADRTVNRYLSSLGAFMTWAENNGYVDKNPVEGLMLKKENKAATLPFKPEELKTLFHSPWFAGCQSADEWRNVAKPGNILIRDHRFWVPLMMAFSGARPSEIGQLAVSDVRQEHGHWIMHITTEGETTTEGKSVKTAGSMRVVPIHPELIKIGFIAYHEKRVKEGGTALFPMARRNERGQMMAELSREFGRYLSRIGLKEGRGLSLYSFRHGAADALRRAGYLDQEFGFILGHTEASMTGKYGIMPQGMLEKRVELVNAIAYAGLTIDHLAPNVIT
ncbi:site-specific integrase [Pseudotabrizicola alkalilacus]|uniref:Site-specific integrase n=1 Tax=Pseudotabrizicola alkalilacus TaxID=2305252 RepID=A0A411Z3R6_9RHOB|nr:site-specific integrase [Pseudotabrizicola alkalilacus]RGP37704.1 site-specific integrase [Pseudotabrizicola alkalilacus]